MGGVKAPNLRPISAVEESDGREVVIIILSQVSANEKIWNGVFVVIEWSGYTAINTQSDTVVHTHTININFSKKTTF